MPKRKSISIFRSINRKNIKKEVKEHNVGISKKYRMKMSDAWNQFQDKKYGKEIHTAILIKNAPNRRGEKKKVYEERK